MNSNAPVTVTYGDCGHRQSRMRLWSRAVIVLSLCILISGCSATRLLYNQLDWLVVWYLDDYFELTDEQRDDLRETVDRHLTWHRQSQLPKYAEFCRSLDRQWAQGASIELIEQRYNQLIEYWDELFEYAMPDIARFLLMLTDEQIDEFLQRVEENNQELLEEYSGETYERRLKQRQKAVIRVTERFVGRLNNNQKGIVRQYTSNLYDNSQEWIEGRRVWQARFTELIRSRPNDFSAQLSGLMLDPNQFDNPDYREKVEQNKRLIFDMYEVLLYQMTDKQRKTLSKRLNRYARDFELLAAEAS